MADNILRVKNLSVKYGSHDALTNVSFDLQRGDFIAVIGPNGSGKTTLIKAIMGLVDTAEGEISWAKTPTDTARIGYLPQKNQTSDKIFPATVEEIVSTGLLAVKKHPKYFDSGDRKRVREILADLNISGLKDKRIGNLSGGQQQRVLLARAMVASPEMLILDEPTSALDPQIRDEFYSLIEKLNKEQGVTMVLVSHDIGSVGKYTHKMIYLDKELIFYGSYEEFCKSEEMTGYFGYGTQHQICWRHNHG